jgi:hypothetical protein
MTTEQRRAPTAPPPPLAESLTKLGRSSEWLRGVASRMLTDVVRIEEADRVKAAAMRSTAHSLLAQASDLDAVKAALETR